MLAAIVAIASWCGATCRQRSQTPMELAVRNVSRSVCPAHSHGLYRLLGSRHCMVPDSFVCVHPPDRDNFVSRGIVKGGTWLVPCNEEFRMRTVCSIARAYRTASAARRAAAPPWVLDVGANIGTFTLPLLAAGVNVVSFEADPHNVALLRGSIEAQRSDRVRAAAAVAAAAAEPAAQQAQAQPPPPPLPPLGQSLVVSGALSDVQGRSLCLMRHKGNSGAAQTRAATAACEKLVTTTTLDDSLVRAGLLRARAPSSLSSGAGAAAALPAIVAMKCDVQGWEANVFAGAARTLADNAPTRIYVETANTSLLGRLEDAHGFKLLRRKDGCDQNAELVGPGVVGDGSVR